MSDHTTTRFPDRHITVGYIERYYQHKNANPNHRKPRVPWLRLQGNWLARAGFITDTKVLIEVTQGRLVITLKETNDEG